MKEVPIQEDPGQQDPPVEPQHVVLYMGIVFAVLIGIMAIFPKDGLPITSDLTLYFPTLSEFIAEDTSDVDMTSIIEEVERLGVVDTTPTPDTLASEVQVEDPELVGDNDAKKIQYPDGDRSVLFPAFRAMEAAAAEEKPVHIFHFGDSQIEGDRMTSLIRARFQEKFGGSGPGLQAPVPAVNSFSVRQSQSENFKRYPGYGRKSPDVTHNRYGATASFARFTPPIADSLLDSAEVATGWLELKKSPPAYNKSKTFSQLRLFYGYQRRKVVLKLLVDDVEISVDTLFPATGLQERTWNFDATPGTMKLTFEGVDSPEIYGVCLQNQSGVVVDNIGLRGQSGTLFSGLERGTFLGMLQSLNTKLVILQFGGNTIPYIKSEKSAKNYGNSVRNQIRFFQRILPDVPIILIGPSDMSTKVKGKFQTYPYLEAVRDALKEGAFEAGAAYFDIYEVMGGHNSMIGWVENAPPLAASDYVHFNPKGARKIAQVFVASFLEDYANFRQAANQQPPQKEPAPQKNQNPKANG